ncbi:MAG: 2-phosphosulfolactate phosphatase [Ignavibacteriae bacterium]|nr:2-phosphosulfolactate phosphatase [Ignavibacteriota bacterium]
MADPKIHLTPHLVDELALRDRVVVVVDPLRAGTCIATALQNGAREVIPTGTVEAAARVSSNLAGAVTMLAGERNGKMIEGFHFGDSPLEFTAERVQGKAIVFLTSNGTPAIWRARHARELAVCGFVNISAVAEFVRQQQGDVEIVCAGNAGGFCIEDGVCAGMLLHLLAEGSAAPGAHFSDAAVAALSLYKGHARGLRRMLRRSDNGVMLEELGFAADVLACSELDTVPVVPLLDGNVLRLRTNEEKKEPAR